jgi:hypothetical protein
LGLRGLAAPPQYSIQNLGIPTGAPNTFVSPLALNDQGHVVGYASKYTATGEFRAAFLWTSEEGYRLLGALPGSSGYSFAVGLNNSDEVVGYSSGGIGGPFLWSASTGMLELPAPVGANPGMATGISDDGTVAINAGPRSYVWNKSTGIRYLPGLSGGDETTTAGPVNRKGQIAGFVNGDQGPITVIWDHDRSVRAVGSEIGAMAISNAGHVAAGESIYTPGQGMSNVGDPPIGGSSLLPQIRGINSSGVAVGVYEFDDLYRSFVYFPGEGIFDLTRLVYADPGEDQGPVIREANAINDAGQIVVSGDGEGGPLLLTPVPEPATAVVLLVPLVLAIVPRQRRRVLACLCVCLGAALVAMPALADYRVIAFSGAPAPGTENGTTFLQFSAPALSLDGKVAFQAGLAGPSVDLTNDAALYAGAPGGWQVLARKGAPADAVLGPGVKQFVFSKVGSDYSYELGPAISQGRIASLAYYAGPGIDYTNDTAIIAGTPEAPVRVARFGDPAPGAPAGVFFKGLTLPRINAAGQYVIAAYIDGPNIVHEHDTSRFSNDSGLWYGDAAGAPRLLARSGDPVPGLPSTYVYAGVFFEANPSVNPSGQVLFEGWAIEPGTSISARQIMMTGTPGNVRKVVATGDSVPGAGDPNIRFFGGRAAAINAGGKVAYVGNFTGPGLFSPDAFGVFFATPSPAPDGPFSTQFLARSGTVAPGTPDRYRYFGNALVNDGGRVVFSASISPTGDLDVESGSGVWTATSPADVRPVFLSGTQVPGLPAGVTLSAGARAFTGDNRILLAGALSGPGVTAENDEAYYLVDLDGHLSKLLREGDLLDPGDGVLRPARNIAVFPNYTGSVTSGTSGFNDLGQLAFRVTFADDRQAIFLASVDPVVIPEPGVAMLGTVATIGLLYRRRRAP